MKDQDAEDDGEEMIWACLSCIVHLSNHYAFLSNLSNHLYVDLAVYLVHLDKLMQFKIH